MMVDPAYGIAGDLNALKENSILQCAMRASACGTYDKEGVVMLLVRVAQNVLLVAISIATLCLVGCPPSPPSGVSVPDCVGMTQWEA